MEPSDRVFTALTEAIRALPAPGRWAFAARHARTAVLWGAAAATALALWCVVVVSSNLAGPFVAPRPTPDEIALMEALKPPPMARSNAVEAFLRVAESLPDTDYYSWSSYRQDRTELAELDRAHAAELTAIREALDLPGEAFRRFEPQELANLDRCIALLAAHGAMAQAKGDAEEACMAGLDAIRVAQAASRGGGFRNAWWGLGAQRVAHRLIGDNMARLGAAANRRVLDRMELLEATRVTLSSVVVDEWRNGMPWATPTFVPLLDRWVKPGQAHEMRRRRYFADLLRASRLPAAFRRLPPADAVPHEWRASALPRDYCRYHDLNAARNRCIVAALTVQSYRFAHGRLPARLTDAAQTPSVRFYDPITNVNVHYRPDGRAREGFVLYSIGPDLHHDGGYPAIEDRMGMPGDIGVRPFALGQRRPAPRSQDYRRVPYMLSPPEEPGWPPVPE
jgi:hypothetical protein